MRIFILLFFIVVSLSVFGQHNPKANKEAVVCLNKDIRFTVLTPRLIRLEWDITGSFTDNASFVVVNRALPVPKFTIDTKQGWYIIRTDELELRYKLNSGCFNADNLQITNVKKNENKFSWRPGAVQKQNLKGTLRTLDKFDGDTNLKGQKIKLEDGLLSKDGWFFLDDSESFLFDNTEWPWVEKRKAGAKQDWYFMGYGMDFKLAIADYAGIAGKIPLPPRYAFGYWWSRFWSYSDNELRKLVDNFEKYDLPLDVLVLDMEWHKVDSLNATSRDEFGQRKWWTGWTWNKSLFPDPAKFLKWTESRGLKTTLNLHPASGMAPFEEKYTAFAERMNFDIASKKNIPFQGSSKKFMNTLFDVVLRPMEKEGVDFWWLDWQQWPIDKDIKGLNNTWWLNHTFFTDMQLNSKKRPMLYHRWGGLGNHRYQIGFSGDVIISWNSLAYQPYFTNTASNVLYGYWSHDIGGHMFKAGQKEELDPELYTRWLQYGALSPIFRTHSARSLVLNKELWNFSGDYLEAQQKIIKLRYALAPYIYTMARRAYDTGLSLCRPMYYDYPKLAESYEYNTQYQFGEDMLVAPIVAPAVNNFSKVKVWFPPGSDWFEWSTGTLIKGGQVLEREFSLDEYPIYIKAGGIIPMYNSQVKNLDKNPVDINIGIFPGPSYSIKMYEDNGDDQNYDKEYATTSIETKVIADKTEVFIHPREGNYDGMTDLKRYKLVLYGTHIPEKVLINNKEAIYTTEALAGSWKYNGKELSLEITLPETNCKELLTVQVYFSKKQQNINNGLVEKFKRLSKATTELKYKRRLFVLPHLIGETEGISLMLEYSPDKFDELITNFNTNYKRIPESLKELKLEKEVEDWFLNYIHFK